MRNLHPMAARAEVIAEMQAAIEASIRNRDPSGTDWTDMHMIKHAKTTFADAGLTLSAATAALEPIMPRVRRFTSGLPHAPDDPLAQRETDAYCFGIDATCFVKLEPKGTFVGYIWYEARTEDTAQLTALRNALLAIDAISPALIADHWLDVTGPVSDPLFLDAYFKSLAE